MLRSTFAGLSVALLCVTPTRAADVPAPARVLGFRPGDDFKLARWPAIVSYVRAVDAASDRVAVQELGTTSEGAPYLVAVVSSPETIADLDAARATQRRIADPRLPGFTPDLVETSKPVVLITCGIHSNETAATLMATELLYGLATGSDPATREILDRTILLLVPSANPDGVTRVADWYERSLGQPWEGEGMPWLYHTYAGHDTNRDWFMLNLKETRLLTRLLYRDWFPTLTYDVHQMGPRGARLFVPPFYDPINPNLDPRVGQGIALLGGHMAADLAAEGKRGVLTNAMYDNWWNGGMRTTPQRHNMVGILTEAASVKLASPMFIARADLDGKTRGFANHRRAVNFVDPWPGGWWRLRDIVDYELTAARSVLTLAARYHAQFQANDRAMALDSIRRGATEPPFAWVVPADQHDPGVAERMIAILSETGVEARQAPTAFTAGGVSYPARSWVLPASQPFRAHLKDMMERQVYPPRFAADGSAEPPYDVAGWTLPLQMGVRAVEVADPFAIPDAADGREATATRPEIRSGPGEFRFGLRELADFKRLNRLIADGVEVRADPSTPLARLHFAASPANRAALIRAQVEPGSTITVDPTPSRDGTSSPPIRPRRVGLYQPWVASMDEGWTRLILEEYGFPQTTLHNAEIRSGGLRTRFDVIILPSVSATVLRDGYGPDATAPAYVGGLGAEGATALRQFVTEGGLLVGLEDASTYLIREFEIPVRNVLADLPTSTFYGPGSILKGRVVKGTDHPATRGLPDDLSLYFDRSLAFEAVGVGPKITPLVEYARTSPLESGWLLGPEKLQGKPAMVAFGLGRGEVVLFGFPPQHRGQTVGTFRLLFNLLVDPRAL